MRRLLSSWRGTGWRLLLAAVVLLLAPAVYAQETRFTAVVVHDQVDVLAGGGTSFYVVGRLPRGTRVTVEDVVNGWSKIVPPEGVYSYVSKGFVDARGDGRSGVINADRTLVYAGSLEGPGDSYRRQIEMAKGQTVQILGEEGSFYRIVPPRGAFVFLPPDAVRRAEGLAPAEPAPPSPRPTPATATERPAPPPEPRPTMTTTERPTPPAPRPTTPPEPRPAPAPATPDEAAPPRPAERTAVESNGGDAPPLWPGARPVVEEEPPPGTAAEPPDRDIDQPRAAGPAEAPPEPPAPEPRGPVRARAESATVQALERRLEEAERLPLDQQPVEELLAAYQAAAAQRDLPPIDLRMVNIRVQQLQQKLALANTLRQLRAAREQVATPIEVPREPAPPPRGVYDPTRYDAFGHLLASSVYDGVAGPRLFRLVDPATQRTIGYVLPGPNVQPQVFLGRIVGVIGQARYDPALKLRVIEVQRMELLTAEGSETPAPRPDAAGAVGPAEGAAAPSGVAPVPTPAGNGPAASPAPAAQDEPNK